MAKFVAYPKRGMVQITEKGKKQLATGRLPLQDLQNDEDFVRHRESVKSEKENEIELQSVNVENASPQDLIDSGFSSIETEVKTNLLERLKEIDPYYFEKVILILLKRMGYGDFVETTKSNDGGIDGIINEDKLGLEKNYTQAKRYNENKVREKDIRNFIGAMSGDTSKGVFITYPPDELHIAFKVLRVQLPDVIVPGTHDVLQGVLKPLVGIHLMCFAHGKEGIGHGCPVGSFVGAGKQVVLPAQSHWTDSIFYQVIVDLKVSIMQVAAQLLPALGAIGDRLSHQTLGQHLCCLPVHPPAHLIENRQGLLQA